MGVIYDAITNEDYERGSFEQLQKECERLAHAVDLLFDIAVSSKLISEESLRGFATDIMFCR